MNTQAITTPHQSQGCAAAVPGAWTLLPRRALTLRHWQPTVLSVSGGRAWVTLDGPHGGVLEDSGDRVLAGGQAMHVPAGQRVVIEAWDARASLHFDWQAQAAPASSAGAALEPAVTDLRVGARLAAGALARLMLGVAGLAWRRVTRRRERLVAMASN